MRVPTLLCALAAFAGPALADGTLPNNFPFLNTSGTAATYSPSGSVDLNHPFHSSPGTNGRTCESCHLPQARWSVRPIDVELLFWLTGGNDPLFNVLDANRPTPPGPTGALSVQASAVGESHWLRVSSCTRQSSSPNMRRATGWKPSR